jgi:hypothetical protein
MLYFIEYYSNFVDLTITSLYVYAPQGRISAILNMKYKYSYSLLHLSLIIT